MEYERNSDIPNWLKWSLTAFNRAGFPALAFLLITYICFVTLKDQTRAIEMFRDTMRVMTQAIDRNTASVERMTQALYRTRP
jgi:hypothetical protein